MTWRRSVERVPAVARALHAPRSVWPQRRARRDRALSIYNTAREIGSNDAAVFAERLQVEDGVDRLAAGPIHFAHAGWARVEILDDSAPTTDERYYLHYYHPNTFESEVLQRKGRRASRPGCLFSAGYSAGWCSYAFNIEVHAREIQCLACGDEHCEFVMAHASRLEERAEEGLRKCRAARSSGPTG
ncbi:MAG: 4-vinyl reductase [Polyangia bacterium]